MTQDRDSVDEVRRKLMQSMGAFPLVAAMTALQSRMAFAATSPIVTSPYGALTAVNDLTTGLPLLQLPAGFTYKSFGWNGDLMKNGAPTPGSHDGMTVVNNPTNPAELWVIRNHEVSGGSDSTFFGATQVYDRGTTGSSHANGGTTHLLFRGGNWVEAKPGIGGTMTNCAGGRTPWGTWLTCEEVASNSASSTGKKHGYVFEVEFTPTAANAIPIVGMGRFKHEAVAIDPATSTAYMTEDNSERAGLYRYVPTVATGAPGSLAQGGVLQMAKVIDKNNQNIMNPKLGKSYKLEWVTIANPDQNTGTAKSVNGKTSLSSSSGPFVQGFGKGGLRMNRGEGITYHNGKIFVMDTAGGSDDRGAIWALDLATQTLTCFYVSSSAKYGDMGDNITASPRGGLIMCEDPDSAPQDEFGTGVRLMGLNSAGQVFIFAKNNYNVTSSELLAAGKKTSLSGNRRGGEFCGACFDSSGTWLFVNTQDPGITFAITGPWSKGPL